MPVHRRANTANTHIHQSNLLSSRTSWVDIKEIQFKICKYPNPGSLWGDIVNHYNPTNHTILCCFRNSTNISLLEVHCDLNPRVIIRAQKLKEPKLVQFFFPPLCDRSDEMANKWMMKDDIHQSLPPKASVTLFPPPFTSLCHFARQQLRWLTTLRPGENVWWLWLMKVKHNDTSFPH